MAGMGFQYTTIWGAIRTIMAQEGVKGLYKGLGPNLLKVAPSMAANWFSFETAKDFLLTLNPRDPA
jgi:solute carrier family 25 phosphate transporter 23/24/25/41